MENSLMYRRLKNNKGGNIKDSIDLYAPVPPNPSKLLRKKIEDKHLQKLTQLNTNTLESLFSEVFQDTSSHETLNKEKFLKVMKDSGFALAKEPQVVESFFNALDVNGNGEVEKKRVNCWTNYSFKWNS